jgi:16S rRNA (adenine1518-N6/adenine1519-N6)-dimethyltransferase
LIVARKRFGQHFLHDAAVIRRIVDAIDPQPHDRMVEIGPGRGALTWPLLARLNQLTALELDRDLAQAVAADPRAQSKLRLITGDALRFDFAALCNDGPRLRIVGNLPYNISTPLIFHLLEQRAAVGDLHVMLQKEVVDRMTASAGSKEYGRLTVMLAAYCRVARLFDIGPGAFQPAPKVWSSLVRIVPCAEPRFPIGSHAALSAVVGAAFGQRRKTLRNGLRALLSSDAIAATGIDPRCRAETLAPEQFGRLAIQHAQTVRGGGRL